MGNFGRKLNYMSTAAYILAPIQCLACPLCATKNIARNGTHMIDKKLLKSLSLAGILLGIGMGSFVEGILFHQIFQFHGMLSHRYFPDTIANEQLNMVWDGIFHSIAWTMTAIGLTIFWRTAQKHETPPEKPYFSGSMILGWGLFNFIVGIIDHHILQLHHVVERSQGTTQVMWDVAFLASGVIMIAVGTYLRRRNIVVSKVRSGLIDRPLPARA